MPNGDFNQACECPGLVEHITEYVNEHHKLMLAYKRLEMEQKNLIDDYSLLISMLKKLGIKKEPKKTELTKKQIIELKSYKEELFK